MGTSRDPTSGEVVLPARPHYTASGHPEVIVFRRAAYQYYTNVNYLSCEKCLAWHGTIRRSPNAFPTLDDGCESGVLQIPPKLVRAYRKQAKRMQARARSELRRRELFEQAMSRLVEAPEEALALFDQAFQIDVYIPDIERLADVHEAFLRDQPEMRDQLCIRFVKAYSDKFGWRRYERLPERMRLQREKAGIDRIRELLG